MATATTTITIDPTKTDVSERFVRYRGTIAVEAAAATYATNGLTVSLSRGDLEASELIEARAWSNTSGWIYAMTATKFLIFGQEPTGGAGVLALSEFTNGAAIPAGVSGDTINIELTFKKIL